MSLGGPTKHGRGEMKVKIYDDLSTGPTDSKRMTWTNHDGGELLSTTNVRIHTTAFPYL